VEHGQGPASAHPAARFLVAVGSGKGGVGKSTMSLNLALALAESGARVGLLDADLYGPNIPLMVGLVREQWGRDWTLARRVNRKVPVIERYGLRVMSAGFLLGEDQPLADSNLARLLVSQLLWHTDWGELDYLVVDLPPGTGGVQQTLVGAAPFSAAVLVVTPQDVAHQDAKKALRMYRAAKVPLVVGVENMSGFACPDCGRRIDLFSRVPEARSLWAAGVETLGAIPLGPEVSEAGDRGRPLLVSHPGSPPAAAFRRIASELATRLRA
jgi:ATP-binding protein involved in chromosome partitioning